MGTNSGNGNGVCRSLGAVSSTTLQVHFHVTVLLYHNGSSSDNYNTGNIISTAYPTRARVNLLDKI